MTRKDYEAIAKAIKDVRDEHNEPVLNIVASRLSTVMINDNPRFDREKFMKACGVDW